MSQCCRKVALPRNSYRISPEVGFAASSGAKFPITPFFMKGCLSHLQDEKIDRTSVHGKRLMDGSPLRKVQFFDADIGYENLWAEESGAGLYVIQSIPFFIYDISVGDTVRVEESAPNGGLSYVATVSRSTHTTVRVRLSEFTVDDEVAKALISEIVRLAGAVECLPPRIIAIDVADTSNVERIVRFLTDKSLRWEWADRKQQSG